MKNTKRILAVLMCALLMLGSISVTAFAADAPTGSITIKNRASSGATIEGKTFVAYKVFNATATADGKHTSYSWGHEAYKEFLFEGTTPLIPANEQGNKTVNDAIVYISSLQEGSLDLSEFAEGLYKKVRDYNKQNNTDTIPVAGQVSIPVAGEGQTAPQSVTIENLPYGYYMVHDETELAGAAVRSAVMLCNVDRNVSVEVELKANRPQIEKKVFDNEGAWSEGTSASIGDIVPFKIETVIPSHTLYSTYSYVIKDVMPDGLALDTASIVVKLVEGEETRILTKGSADSAGDYSLSFGDSAVNDAGNIIDAAANVDEFVDGEKTWDFVISFNNLKALGMGNKLVVEYNAKVTKNAQPLNDNAAVLEYSNDPLHEESRGYSGNIARVNVYKMILTKVAADASGQTTNIHLAGAKFKLSDASGNLMNFVKEEKIDNGNTYIQYRVAENGETSTVTELEVYDPNSDTNSGSSIEARSAQTGNLVIYGLKEGVYTLEEIQAPDGYILPNKPFTLTITDTIGSIGGIVSSLSFVGEHKDDNLGIVDNARGDYTTFTVAADITNMPGTALPETGGMGTTLFTILGIILMAGAAAYLVVRRKKANA